MYPLIAYYLALSVDFPTLYRWEGDYLVVGYVKDYETQPIVVVVENFLYRGSMMMGGSGSCKAFSGLPAQLWKGDIIVVENDIVRLRYLGEERVLQPEDVWTKEATMIEHLGLASYSTRVEYLGVTDSVRTNQPMELQYQEGFPVIAITNSVHVDPIPFLNVFDLTGQIVTAILCILAVANGYYIIRNKGAHHRPISSNSELANRPIDTPH